MPGRSIRTEPQHPNGILPVRRPIEANTGDEMVLTFKSDGDRSGADFRVALRPADPLEAGLPAALAAALKNPAGFRGKKIAPLSGTPICSAPPGIRAQFNEFKKLRLEMLECRNGRAQTLVTEAWKPVPTRVLPRGNWQDETGDIRQSGATAFSTAAQKVRTTGASPGSISPNGWSLRKTPDRARVCQSHLEAILRQRALRRGR